MRVVNGVEHVRELGAELWKGGRGPILVAVAGGWLLSLGVRMVYPAILPQLRADYGLDLTTAGLLITALWGAYALGQLPGGLLDDRFGGGRVLAASTLVSAVALAFVVTAGSITVIFAATVAFGFATALYGVARFTILAAVYPERGGTAIGLTMAAGDLGNSLLPPLAGALAVAVAWQAGLGFSIPLFLLAAAGLSLAVPGNGRTGESEDANASRESTNGVGLFDALSKLVTALTRRPVAMVAVIQTLGYCVWQGFTGFYPTYLVEVKGLAPTTATALFGGFFALGILVKPVAGAAYDAHGLRRALPVVLVAITASLVVLPLVESTLALVAVTALASSVLGYGTITLTYLTDSLPAEIRGTGLGSLRTAYMLVGAGSPVVIGVFGDAGYFDEAFWLLAGVAAVTLVLSVLVPER